MNEVNKILVVGLGNPGKQYKNTPHNAGFETINTLIAQISNDEFLISKDEKSYAAIWKTDINKSEVIFVKPLLYMNRSGSALKKLITDYLPAAADRKQADRLQDANCKLIVIHDDADLPMGTMRRGFGSSSGGHKGVQDIIEKTGTQEFYRFRIGVRPEHLPEQRTRELMQKFVTQKIKRKERKAFANIINNCAEIIYKELREGGLDMSTKNYKV